VAAAENLSTTSTSATATAATAGTNVSTPSSLFGFLAPGGQLPVHKDGSGVGPTGTVVTGKPSIVKVTLSPPGQPQQQPQQQQQHHQQYEDNNNWVAAPPSDNCTPMKDIEGTYKPCSAAAKLCVYCGRI